jgi:RNA polymerase sigma-70 factor (ECF subfamily)
MIGTLAPDLASMFRQHLAPAAGETVAAGEAAAAAPSVDALAGALHDALAAARAEWPALDVDPEEFVVYLAQRVGTADAEVLRTLRSADLYLCCGCALGDPRALRAFEDQLLPEAAAALARAGIAPELRDEVLQQLRMRLFIPDAEGKARIVGYSGKGALASWLRVAVVRIALNLQKSQRRYVPLEPDDELLQVLPSAPDPEFLFLKSAYREACRAALRDAVAALPALERTLLYLQFIDGLGIDQIGAPYKVSRATAARWLVHARGALLRETQRRLAAQLKISPEEATRLIREVQSQLLSTLSGLLGQRPPG